MDELIWSLEKPSQSICVKDLYAAFSFGQPPSSPIFPLKFWKASCPLKMILFSWLFFLDRNLTWEVLQRKGWQGPGRCQMCLSEAESNSHMFFQCAASSPLLHQSVATSEKDPIKEWILGEGGASKIQRIIPVGGGCISVANRYDTEVGSFFVKTNRDKGPSMFEAEAIGLNAMHSTNTIRVPKPFKVGSLFGRGSYIIMEFIEFGSSRGEQRKLGRKLAEMHKAGISDKGFGFMVDNTIGSTPQVNSWTSDWVTFYSEHRLGYQFSLAQQQYRDNDIYEKGQRLLQKLPQFFKDTQIKPCLLHGDLWSGNICSDKNNEPVILDPACYYGHNEAEFGMSWCAGFGSSFYDSYFEVMPKQSGFDERRNLYLLYHYLNHYNMFGSSYRSSCTSILDNYLRLLNA